MIKQYSWKHLGIAIGLTVILCVGFFIYNQWDLARFRKSFVEETPQESEKQQSEKTVPGETSQQPTLTPSETGNGAERSSPHEPDSENSEEKDVKEADFYDFLDFLDELETEEIAKLIESLDLEDDEKEALSEFTEQKSENTENIHPSSMIVDLMESGVASLADLIDLMEESKTVLPESAQERFEPTLQLLRTMQTNGGGLIFHRPPENPSRWMLLWINPDPSQRMASTPLGADNIIHEIPSDDPSKPSLFLHKGNSIIID